MKDNMSTKEFLDTIIECEGDLLRLDFNTIRDIAKKASLLKDRMERQKAAEERRRRDFHEVVVDNICRVMENVPCFTPSQVMIAESQNGGIPFSHQLYTIHLKMEANRPNGRIKVVSPQERNITYYVLGKHKKKSRYLGHKSMPALYRVVK